MTTVVHSDAGDAEATLVVGNGPEQHRLHDLRVMLPGLKAQRVRRLRVHLPEETALGEAQLTELCKLQASCNDRGIELDLVGLDHGACETLRTAHVRRQHRPRA